MRRSDSRKHQRHPDVVVEVAFGRQRRGPAAEACGNQLLYRRLAVTAGHTDHGNLVFIAPRGPETAKRQPRVIDADLRDFVIGQRGDHGARRTTITRGADEFPAVKIRTLQRKEQLPVTDRSRIRADACEAPVRAVQRTMHAGSGAGKICNHRAPSLAARARDANA